jgi:predicted acetyltransferase
VTAPTPPHLAQPQIEYASPERRDAFFAAVVHGFHLDHQPEQGDPFTAVFEPDRSFGFTVDGRWISTCGAFTQTMITPGGSVPTAAVTQVTVAPSYRRRGLLRAMMTHQLEDIAARGREPMALLWASESSIYGRFGYGETLNRFRLTGETRPVSFAPHVDFGDGSVGEVDRDVFLPAAKQLRAGWLADRPGALERSDEWWEVRLHDPEQWRQGASAYRFALHFTADSSPDGYLIFRVKESEDEVQIVAVDAIDSTGYAALWRFVLSLDLVRRFRFDGAPIDEPLRFLVNDPRAISAELRDGTYARIIDVPRALEARRYAAEADLVIDIVDPILPANQRTFRWQGGPDGASVKPSRRKPDLVMNVRELGAIYLGGISLATLHRSGLIEERTPGAVVALSGAFAWSRLPYCNDFF